jgi:hypothetical protein
MTEMATLLSPASNYAVIQLPRRKLPGIIVQGDSAHSLLAQVGTIQKLANKSADEDLDAEIESLRQLLSEVVSHYEMVCSREGMQLPTPNRVAPGANLGRRRERHLPVRRARREKDRL